MKLAALVLAAAVNSPPSSSPQSAPTILMSPEQAALCESEGGCAVVTRQFLDEVQRRAFDAGKQKAMDEAENACWRSRKEA